MPEFKMPTGRTVAGFNELDSFIQGFIEAMFFTECHSDNPELENATFDDIAGEALMTIITDCQQYQQVNAQLLTQAYEHDSVDYDATMAGRDYWFTRNGHGVGFWDRDLGDVGQALSDETEMPEMYIYRGDDELVYVS